MTPTTTSHRRARNGTRVLCAAACAAGLLGALTAAPAQAASRQLTVTFGETIGQESLEGAIARSAGLDVVTSGGGSLQRVVGPDGERSAVRTPAFSALSNGKRAILAIESKDPAALSPEDGDFVMRADVAVDKNSSERSSTDNGDNVLQRGHFATAQYKIQVDHHVPSCRVAGSEGAVLVQAPEEIAPGEWYRISCRREGSTLALVVKKSTGNDTWQWVSRTTASGPIGSVDFDAGVPLSVGGKLNDSASIVAKASDQFNGAFANIMLRFS